MCCAFAAWEATIPPVLVDRSAGTVLGPDPLGPTVEDAADIVLLSAGVEAAAALPTRPSECTCPYPCPCAAAAAKAWCPYPAGWNGFGLRAGSRTLFFLGERMGVRGISLPAAEGAEEDETPNRPSYDGELGPEEEEWDDPGICNRPATGVLGSSVVGVVVGLRKAGVVCPVPLLTLDRVDSASKKTSSEGVESVGLGARLVVKNPSAVACVPGVSGSGTPSAPVRFELLLRRMEDAAGLLTSRRVSPRPFAVLIGSSIGALDRLVVVVVPECEEVAAELWDVRADHGAVSSLVLLPELDPLGLEGG